MEINGVNINGNYVKVCDKDGGVHGYIIQEDEDRGMTIDTVLRNMGMDPDLTYYRFVEKHPDGMSLERKGSWCDIKTWKDVVNACERNEFLYAEYRNSDGFGRHLSRLAYKMVKYAIDGDGCQLGHGYVPRVAIVKEGGYPGDERGLYPLAGKLVRGGVRYDVYQAMPLIANDTRAIDMHVKGTVNPFGNYDWLAMSSAEKATHVSTYFAKELLDVVYGNIDYVWEEI